MRLLPLIFIMLAGSLVGGEPANTICDGHESVADYAKRANLPPTKTLELGNGVKLELVLIPAGKFIMGTPEPTPVDEGAYQLKILTAQVWLAASGGALLILLGFVLVPAVRKRRRPQLSLRLLLLVTVATGGCVLGGLHWRQSANELQATRLEYTAAEARFKSADEREKPAHAVTLTQPFYMGKYDVTQEQYQAVIGTNLSQFKGKDNPVEMVSWDDAQAFCMKLTERTKETVRLPTEAEWEYGCRAGTTTAYHSGDAEADLGRVAWYDANSKTMTHPVGQKEANVFGLFDMHGNVWQWCQDRYEADYYRSSTTSDPQGPQERKHEGIMVGHDPYDFQTLRGGSWSDNPDNCRSSFRGCTDPRKGFNIIGFRVVMALANK